jgi:transposase
MVAAGRYSLAQVARELDLRPEMLRRWKRQVEQDGDQAFPGHGHLKADDEQLRQLLRENLRLREERDILKKAVAIFSERRR